MLRGVHTVLTKLKRTEQRKTLHLQLCPDHCQFSSAQLVKCALAVLLAKMEAKRRAIADVCTKSRDDSSEKLDTKFGIFFFPVN